MKPVALAVAKAPVPGFAKTRLAVDVGEEAAATLAAAALHDTLDACEQAFGAQSCYLALDGDLDAAVDGAALRARLAAWTVLPQRGDDFADRLAQAHAAVADVTGRPVVQVGMDTPQMTAEHLLEVAHGLAGHRAVLGPAEDGGWWVLALAEPAAARALLGLRMSSPSTGADTRRALTDAGLGVGIARTMRDVDTAEDAHAVVAVAPGTRFATAWAFHTEAATR